jgi:hypothetical protein
VTGIPHRFTRPAWLCADCDQPWPCQPRRQALLDEHAESPTALYALMCSFLGDAIEDLPDQNDRGQVTHASFESYGKIGRVVALRFRRLEFLFGAPRRRRLRRPYPR